MQQVVDISLADFVSAALRAGYSSSPKQIGFERWVSFSAARRSSSRHDSPSRAKAGSPTGGPGMSGQGGDSDHYDPRSEVRSPFQTGIQGRRLEPVQGHKHVQGKESRGREKIPRSGSASMTNSNRERKVRIRVPRNSPPVPQSITGSSSSPPVTLDRFLGPYSEGTVSPRHSDRSTTHFINGTDGQTSRFLFGSGFQAPRSFTDFTGMGVVGVGVGTGSRSHCAVPRVSIDSTVPPPPAAFAPYSHPSFEDYSANSTAPSTFSPLEATPAESAATSASCFLPTQQDLPPVPLYPAQSPLPNTVKGFSSVYTLPLPPGSFIAEGKVNTSSGFVTSQPFGLDIDQRKAIGDNLESRGVVDTFSDAVQYRNGSLRSALGYYRRMMGFSLTEVFVDFEGLLSANKRTDSTDPSAGDGSIDVGLDDSEDSGLGRIVTTLLCNAAARMLVISPSDSDTVGSSQISLHRAVDNTYLELLRECFNSLDIDRDGFLSLSDFTEEVETLQEGCRAGQGEDEVGSEEKCEGQRETPPTSEVSPSWSPAIDTSSSDTVLNKVQAVLFATELSCARNQNNLAILTINFLPLLLFYCRMASQRLSTDSYCESVPHSDATRPCPIKYCAF